MFYYRVARESAVLRATQRAEMSYREYLRNRSTYMVVLADNRDVFGILGRGQHPTDTIRQQLDSDGLPWSIAVYYFVRDNDMSLQGGVLHN